MSQGANGNGAEPAGPGPEMANAALPSAWAACKAVVALAWRASPSAALGRVGVGLASQLAEGLLLGLALQHGSLLPTVVVLAAVDPLLVLPVAAAGGGGMLRLRARRLALKMHERALGGQRLAAALVEVATGAASAKDVRVLGLPAWLLERHRRATDEVTRSVMVGERKTVVAAVMGGGLKAALVGAGIALLVYLAGRGTVSAGQVVLALVLLRSGVADTASLGVFGADLAHNTFLARRYLWLTTYQPPVRSLARPAPVPERLEAGVALACQLHLPRLGPGGPVRRQPGPTRGGHGGPGGRQRRRQDHPGQAAVPLLRPERRLDHRRGHRLGELDLEAWRAVTTGAFQDFVRMCFSAGESVGVGELADLGDDSRVGAAARAGVSARFLEAMPEGYGTQLGRHFPRGEDLSEGQWQKVALSRSAMRGSPLVVLLDEPTAALDAAAEHELFERFAAEAASARSRGGLTVLVSHRFSTVRCRWRRTSSCRRCRPGPGLGVGNHETAPAGLDPTKGAMPGARASGPSPPPLRPRGTPGRR
ncbi:MAG: ABC transporter ATP-binding protein [Acidimicrobiales bacterium]